MSEKEPVRIDKFLWAIRIYKTRSLATDACKIGRITINGNPVKPSKTVEANDIISVKKPPAIFSYKVIMPLENRTSAKLVINYLEDITPESERNKIEIGRSGFNAFRKKGTGRPTKKERRTIDRWREEVSGS